MTSLNESEKHYLLRLARQTLDLYFSERTVLKIAENDVPERLKAKQGAFVTLTQAGDRLRGCVGLLEPIKPLYQAVIDNALAAAFFDDRFLPLDKSEWPLVKIEISVLSAPVEMAISSPAERLRQLRPLADGVILKAGKKVATYLPQVWEELKKPEEFLSSLCQKGGWSGDCWKNPEVKIYTYQAEVFEE